MLFKYGQFGLALSPILLVSVVLLGWFKTSDSLERALAYAFIAIFPSSLLALFAGMLIDFVKERMDNRKKTDA